MENQARRFFIALPVDDKDSIKSLTGIFKHLNEYKHFLKIVPPDNYHITLKFFGSVEPRPADALVKTFLSLKNLKKTEYKVEGLGAFPTIDSPSVIWAGLKCDEIPLGEIFKSVENMASILGYPPEKRKFVPHLTLARIKREKEVPRELKQYLVKEKNTRFTTSVFEELVLFESILKSIGPEYKRIETISLI